MTCWKEIDTVSTGFLSERNIQTFFRNIGVDHPEIHKWLFKRFGSSGKEKLDINDFRRIFDYMGHGILGNGADGNKLLPEISKGLTKNKQGAIQVPMQDKLSAAAKKRKSSIKASKSEYQKRMQSHLQFTLPGHPKDTHKQKIFNMHLMQGHLKVEKDSDAKLGVTLKSGKYISAAEQRVHSDFVNNNKRKNVLLKQYLHDTRLLSKNHDSKVFYYELELLKTLLKISELQRNLTSCKFDLCLREDFNLFTLFKHFDRKKASSIGLPEFENGLAEFNMFPHRSDLCLVLKSYDRRLKTRIDFEDFCSMMVPRDQQFSNMMMERVKLNKEQEGNYIRTISEDTFKALTTFFNELIAYSVASEALRQRLITEVGIDLHLAFIHLPKAHRSLLSSVDLDRLFKTRNIQASFRDLSEFVKAHDLDGDGKLSYAEFARCFTPLMSVAY